MFRKTLINFIKHKNNPNQLCKFPLVLSYSNLHNFTNRKPNVYVNITSKLYITTHTSSVFNNFVSDEDLNVNLYSHRTHTCGELRSCDVGKRITLCGWVQYLRMSKFLLLRDSYGIIQCVTNDTNVALSNIPEETVVKIEGFVGLRPIEMINKNMDTGEVEVIIKRIQILNSVEELPFTLRNYQKPKEQLRLQYRYLDLRFPEMQNNLRLRSLMLHNMRRFLIENRGFTEVETPTLFCRTPGGAREFIVPTRHKNMFYSLVQSPQQYKQMLMAGGFDRYFQIARCYRDETTRPDRQPEFTQLDLELSFTDLNGVLTLIEELMFKCYLKPIKEPPFRRITFNEALETYGSDKPNLKFDLKFLCIKKYFPDKTTNNDFSAYALPYPKELGKLTAKYKESIKTISKKYKATKIVLFENLDKEFGTDLTKNIEQLLSNGTSAILALGEKSNTCLCLGEIRCLLGNILISKNLVGNNEDVAEPLWVVDFPLFVKGEDGNLETCHHPFTAPHPDDIHLLDENPLAVRSLAYDLVLDGNEIGGGSVRVHNSKMQEKLLQMLNIDPSSLSHFLNALKSGCPPHAGIALGIDRLMAQICNAESIRDVIAFPKTHEGKDPLSGAPTLITDEDKKYYHIKTVE